MASLHRFAGTLLAGILVLSFFAPTPALAADGQFGSWYGSFRQAVAKYARWANSDYEEQVRMLLSAKPQGGSTYWETWLGDYTGYLDDLDRGGVIPQVLGYMERGRPDIRMASNAYVVWFNRLIPMLKEYTRFNRQDQLQAIRRMATVAPRGGNGAYEQWLATYNQYVEEYRRWGRQEFKIVLDLLVQVKPGSAYGPIPEWLRDPHGSAEIVVLDPEYTGRFIDVVRTVRGKLAFEAARGNQWAREALHRLRNAAQ